jgi:hypothetical protein
MDIKNVMRLPELNLLSPSMETTFKKLVEEIAECNTAIEDLKKYEKANNTNCLLLSDEEVSKIRSEYKVKLNDVMGEIMDIAQVCATQLFVFENSGINVRELFKEYEETFEFNEIGTQPIFNTINNCRYIHFYPTTKGSTLQSTMNQIILSMGKVAQLAKFTGENGEVPTISVEASIKRYAFELFTTIQNCFNLLYSMDDKYRIDMTKLFDDHVDKLVRRGYCKL